MHKQGDNQTTMSNGEFKLTLLSANGSRIKDHRQALRVVGIDLGTTNSTLSEILITPDATGLPDPVPIEIQQVTELGEFSGVQVPSIVALHNGVEYIGEGAKMLRPQSGRHGLVQNRDMFWDCKNDIGTSRTYHKAREGYRSSGDIAARLLRFMYSAAQDANEQPIESTVVTIPASFQSAQRQDTVMAAKTAGLNMLDGGCLLDEPTAAFIAYIVSGQKQVDLQSNRNLLVFDFGGGTCDVALFKLFPEQSSKNVDIAPLSVSRYCRLGGGDIDRTIIVEVLLPQLIEQNDVNAKDLDYEDKQSHIIPALLGAAEILKIGLCQQILHKRGFQVDSSTAQPLEQMQPGTYQCKLRSGKELLLTSPRLNEQQLNQVLEPFLDEDILYPQENEYVTTCSMFAPIKDALDRSDLNAQDIDYCLLAGGSSLIPQVADSLGEYFSSGEILQFGKAEDMLTAVSKGAALHALSIALNGKGIFRTVNSRSIFLRTEKEPKLLLEKGTDLPSADLENHDLAVPRSSLLEPVMLRVELCDSDDRTLFAERWDIDPPINQGDLLKLQYKMDVNQVFHLELSLADSPHDKFTKLVENPLTHVVNVNARREQVLQLEEQMRTGNFSAAKKLDVTRKIADYEVELGRYERALSLLLKIERISSDTGLLIRIAQICERMKDYESEEKYCQQAASRDRSSGSPFFHLALSRYRQAKRDQAMAFIDRAIDIDPLPPYRVLKAEIAYKEGDTDMCNTQLELAKETFDPVPVLGDWSLHWCWIGAKLAEDRNKEHECEKEWKKRQTSRHDPEPAGDLPISSSGQPVAT